MATEVLNLTCVQCPMGCPLQVSVQDGVVTGVQGNSCPRGKTYGEHEAVAPERVVTSLISVAGDYHPVSVKTSRAVPKERIGEVLAAISAHTAQAPVVLGEVLIRDVCGTGADVCATKAHA